MSTIGKASRTTDPAAQEAATAAAAVSPGKATLTDGLAADPGAGTVLGGTGAAARELAANERVLSRDPTYAADGYLGWFRDQVKAKLEPWDLAFA